MDITKAALRQTIIRAKAALGSSLHADKMYDAQATTSTMEWSVKKQQELFAVEAELLELLQARQADRDERKVIQ